MRTNKRKNFNKLKRQEGFATTQPTSFLEPENKQVLDRQAYEMRNLTPIYLHKSLLINNLRHTFRTLKQLSFTKGAGTANDTFPGPARIEPAFFILLFLSKFTHAAALFSNSHILSI